LVVCQLLKLLALLGLALLQTHLLALLRRLHLHLHLLLLLALRRRHHRNSGVRDLHPWRHHVQPRWCNIIARPQ
jgi:hypothetical protein